MEDETTINAIYRLLDEMRETRERIKDMKENIKDVLLQNAEYQAIQEDLKALTAKRQEAKKLLEADRDYQALLSELEELKFKQKDLTEIMSHHLVVHRDSTGDNIVKDPEGEARQIIVNAKLGKPELITNQMSIHGKIDGYEK